MFKLSLVPGVQVVPAAMGIATDHSPEAQRWNDEPSEEQKYSPSSEQDPLIDPAEVDVEDEVAAEDVEEASAVVAATAELETTGEDSTTGETAEGSVEPDVTAVAVAAGVEESAEPLAKPLLAADEAVEATVADEEADVELPEEELLLEDESLEAAQPTGGPRLAPVPTWSELPGLGYSMSIPSVVVQPFETPSRLATKRSGKAVVASRFSGGGSEGPHRLVVAADTVAGPQFM